MKDNLIKIYITLIDDSKWYTYANLDEIRERFNNCKPQAVNPDSLEVTHETKQGIKRTVLFSEICKIEWEA